MAVPKKRHSKRRSHISHSNWVKKFKKEIIKKYSISKSLLNRNGNNKNNFKNIKIKQ